MIERVIHNSVTNQSKSRKTTQQIMEDFKLSQFSRAWPYPILMDTATAVAEGISKDVL